MAPSPIAGERKEQEDYWKEQIGQASDGLCVKSMMLDSQAALLDAQERPEILGLLPSLEGGVVVELGSGIGRFTGALADMAAHVTAVDFMANLVEKELEMEQNKETNGKRQNLDLLCADVMTPAVQFENETIDLVFSNWLFMYLSDNEVEVLGTRIIKWLKPGSHFFLRESCFHQSGDHKRKSNPTHYREPFFYTQVFKKLQVPDENGKLFQFELEKFCCVNTYVRIKQSQNQVCWLWKKVLVEEKLNPLDDGQYSVKGILKYERIFGEGYVSTGGIDTTRDLVEKLSLKPGERVLDIGSGLGGGDLYMAENFGAYVTGIDYSVNMISLALERAIGSKCLVEYEWADCTKKEYPEGTFDVVYSRDTILHIHDKPALFREVFKWLKPNGRLLITDYCCGDKTKSSDDFKLYVAQRGYDLHQPHEYGKILEDVGFVDVVAKDNTDQFMEILKNELRRTEERKEKFLADFSQDGYNDIVEGWKAKLERCAKGDQKWGLFMARKPA